ncbi:MAG: hypothetical protein ACKOI2_07315 [Actinomycetota bacterium]
MRGLVHPFSKALYELDDDGTIRVTKDGVSGTFSLYGRHLAGELRECDPQMCGWVGGPQVANHRFSGPTGEH